MDKETRDILNNCISRLDYIEQKLEEIFVQYKNDIQQIKEISPLKKKLGENVIAIQKITTHVTHYRTGLLLRVKRLEDKKKPKK